MKRLMILSVMMSLFLALSAGTPSFAADAKCKDNSSKCAKTCEQAAKKLEKKKGDAALVKQMRDCAKACTEYTSSNGKNQATCKDACSACAEACKKTGDASLQACAKACEACADCCK